MEMEGEHPGYVSPKHLKIDETLEENRQKEEDRITALPDCLIVQILSLLPSRRDVIRAGTLSKRWHSIWTSIPIFIFKHSPHKQSTSEFVSIVNKTLAQRHHPQLNKFEISIKYDARLESQINDWIRYSVSRNVEVLNLTLSNLESEDECSLPELFFINSFFTDLRLRGFVFNPKGAVNWGILRSLCISRAKLDEDLIENILSGSPVLETLELESCYGYRRLDIASKSVKNLVFRGYDNPRNDSNIGNVVEINAPNILLLKILSGLLLYKLSLLDVSSLVEVELDYTKLGYGERRGREAEEGLKELIQSLHHVKEVKVGMYCAMVLSRLEANGFAFPPNMKFRDVASQWCFDSD